MKLTKTNVRAVRIHLLQQLFPDQRDVVLAFEPSPLDRNLPASNGAEPQREWGGGFKKGTAADVRRSRSKTTWRLKTDDFRPGGWE